jgi:hypothetical protein
VEQSTVVGLHRQAGGIHASHEVGHDFGFHWMLVDRQLARLNEFLNSHSHIGAS